MKRLTIALLITSFTAFSQSIDFSNYQGLECKGSLPDVFTTSLEQKVKEHQQEIVKKGDRYGEKREKKRFALYASYSLSELVLNGEVLFGDELTTYVSKIGKKVLEKSKFKNKDQVEFFVVKSPYVNAFTTNEGKIFVSVGLLAQLETEAQLAYILCHEIAHFEHNHVLEGFLFDRGVDKKSKNRYSSGSSLLKKSIYSKSKELEADEEGLELFIKTKYSTTSLVGVFDILKFAHLPIDEVKFDPSFLENENFKISASSLPDSINAIALLENPELSTHPSSERRAEKIETLLTKKGKKGKHFLFGEKDFLYKRDISRFELSKILLEKRQYQALLYNNNVLSKKFPDNYFLDFTTGRALYFLSKYKLRGETNEIMLDADEIQGESQSIYHLVENMSSKAFALLSTNYLWKMVKKYPADKKFRQLATSVFTEAVYMRDIDESSFVKKPKAEYLAEINSNDTIEDQEEGESEDGYKRSSKYKKITEKIEEQEKGKVVDGELEVTDEQAIFYIFGSYFDDPEFVEMFNDVYTYKQWRVEYDDKISELKTDKKKWKKYKKDNNYRSVVWNDKKDERLGIDTLIFVDPVHLVFDVRKKNVFRMENSTEKQRDLSQHISESSKKIGMKTILLDSKDLKGGETERFNDLVNLNRMIRELNVHSDLDSIVLSDFKGLEAIAEKYGTNKVAWNMMVSITEPDGMSAAALIAVGVYLWPALPFLIYDVATPDKTTLNFFFVYDISKGAIVYQKKSKIKGRTPNPIIKQNIYHHLEQLNNEPKSN